MLTYLSTAVHSIDDYLKLGKTIIVVECLSNDQGQICGRWFCRKLRVLEVFKGDLKKEQEIEIAVEESARSDSHLHDL